MGRSLEASAIIQTIANWNFEKDNNKEMLTKMNAFEMCFLIRVHERTIMCGIGLPVPDVF